MKIRSYKGKSLGSIYEAINKELGPEAVVVCPDKQGRGIAGMFSLPCSHELIAVVDDGSSENHLLKNVLKSDEILKEITRQRDRQRDVERLMRELRDEVAGLVEKKKVSMEIGSMRPEHTIEWDSRFLCMVSSVIPEALIDVRAEGLTDDFAGMFRVEQPKIERLGNRPHVAVLVGPTGSGKTTTMAKLAARWWLEKKKKVGLITADTFRVAAIDQTREYAKLLGLKLKVVFTAEEAKKAVAGFSDCDVVFVDTPGRSHMDSSAISELGGLLEAFGAVTKLLLVPATTRKIDLGDMLKSFKVLDPSHLVVTKLDETREFSIFTSLASGSACPVAYVTDGQRVPGDLRVADARSIAGMVLRGKC